MDIFGRVFGKALAEADALNRLDETARRIEGEARYARALGASAGARIEDVQRDVARLALVVETLTRLLVQKGLCTQDELGALALSVDLEDGKADGVIDRSPVAPPPRTCLACGHVVGDDAIKCVYCGASIRP